jgi:CRISPR system Cascade subunit CasA
LLRSRSERLGALIGAAIAFADDAGSALRALQRNFRSEMRARAATDIDLPYWPRLTRPFDGYLRMMGECLTANQSEVPAAEEWAREVNSIAMNVADQWVSGTPAETGKIMVLGKPHSQFLSRLAIARRTFDERVRIHSSGEGEPE